MAGTTRLLQFLAALVFLACASCGINEDALVVFHDIRWNAKYHVDVSVCPGERKTRKEVRAKYDEIRASVAAVLAKDPLREKELTAEDHAMLDRRVVLAITPHLSRDGTVSVVVMLKHN